MENIRHKIDFLGEDKPGKQNGATDLEAIASDIKTVKDQLIKNNTTLTDGMSELVATNGRLQRQVADLQERLSKAAQSTNTDEVHQLQQLVTSLQAQLAELRGDTDEAIEVEFPDVPAHTPGRKKTACVLKTSPTEDFTKNSRFAIGEIVEVSEDYYDRRKFLNTPLKVTSLSGTTMVNTQYSAGGITKKRNLSAKCLRKSTELVARLNFMDHSNGDV